MSEYVDVAIIENGEVIGTTKVLRDTEERAREYATETLLLSESDPTHKAIVEAYLQGAAGYEKQKEINKELVDDIAELHKRIRQLETQIKQANEQEARDIRTRFPC